MERGTHEIAHFYWDKTKKAKLLKKQRKPIRTNKNSLFHLAQKYALKFV